VRRHCCVFTSAGIFREVPMTTLYDPPAHRLWRVNRVAATLSQVASACASTRLTRTESLRLAKTLRETADLVADLYICPVCGHPEACACA